MWGTPIAEFDIVNFYDSVQFGYSCASSNILYCSLASESLVVYDNSWKPV